MTRMTSLHLRTTIARCEALITGADIVIMIGGLSYIDRARFKRLLDCFPAGCHPWVVWFPLCHVNGDSVTDTLVRFGLKTEWLTTLTQR